MPFLQRWIVAVLTTVVLALGVSGAVAASAKVLPDPGTASALREHVGEKFLFDVTGATDGSVWGTGTYTDDSSIAAAAVHAGLLKAGETKQLTVEITGPKSNFKGSTAHGVVSGDYGAWDGSFKFVGKAVALNPDEPLPDPGNLNGFRDQQGKTLRFAVTGSASGSVWGTGVYTDDSSLATAAVHAGLLEDGQDGVVAVKIMPGEDSYKGSTRNGVESRDYGPWEGSYAFVVKKPAKSHDRLDNL